MNYPESVPGINLLNGKFFDGDPVNGIPGSLDPAAWANAITDEVLTVARGAGLVPDERRTDQLYSAIQTLIQNGINGLLASPLFASNLGVYGYQKLPGGLILQWGLGTASTNGTLNNFPIAFPKACLGLTIGQYGPQGVTYCAGNLAATGFVFYNTGGTGNHQYLAIGY